MKFLNAPSGGYVFIVTWGRSGSTLLQNLLNGFEGWCIRGENNNTLSHLARAWEAVEREQVMRSLRRPGRSTTRTHPWYGAELIDPDRYGRMLANGFVREILRLPEDVRVGGFKEIRFHQDPRFFRQHMEFIRRFFPNPRFVFNTRDPAATARSGWWAQMDPEKVTATLTRAGRLYDDFAAAHPRLSLRLRYEDYNGNPDGFRPLFDFLKVPWDRMLAERVLSERLEHLKTPE